MKELAAQPGYYGFDSVETLAKAVRRATNQKVPASEHARMGSQQEAVKDAVASFKDFAGLTAKSLHSFCRIKSCPLRPPSPISVVPVSQFGVMSVTLRPHASLADLEEDFGQCAALPALDCTEGVYPTWKKIKSWIVGEQSPPPNPTIFIPNDVASALVFQSPREHLEAACRTSNRAANPKVIEGLWRDLKCDLITLDQSVTTLSTGEQILTLIAAGLLMLPEAKRAVIANPARSLFPERRESLWRLLSALEKQNVETIVQCFDGDPMPNIQERIKIMWPVMPIEWQLSVNGVTIEYPEQVGVVRIPPRKLTFHSRDEWIQLTSPTLLYGNNGVGKSTLAKALCDVVAPSKNRPIRVKTQYYHRCHGGRLLFPDSAQQLFSFTPSAHIDEVYRFDQQLRKETLDIIKELKKITGEIARESGLIFRWDTDSLDSGILAARMVFAAERLAGGCGFIVLDEPTSMCSQVDGTILTLAIITAAHARRIAVLVISHDDLLTECLHGSRVVMRKQTDGVELAKIE